MDEKIASDLSLAIEPTTQNDLFSTLNQQWKRGND